MAKFCGMIGYSQEIEETPGVWVCKITERKCYGDLNKNFRKLQSANQINDNIVIYNEVSIVADPYAFENFHSIRYVTFMGTKWKVTDIDVQFPRLILNIGGIYND